MSEQRTPPVSPPPADLSALAQERSFPLVALLQLATFWAALTACIDGAKLRDMVARLPQQESVVWALVAGVFLVGSVIGFFVGLGQVRVWRSAATGVVVGSLCGGGILAVYVAPAPVGRAFAAAAMLLLTTMAFRLRTP
jgi:hypothetical protein